MDWLDFVKRYGPRVLAAIYSFIMIVWASSLTPTLAIFTRPEGAALPVALGIIAGFFAYINRFRIASFITTLIVIGGIVYHVYYFFAVKAAIPLGLGKISPELFNTLEDPYTRGAYYGVLIATFIIALIVAATIKHPLELVSYYISLTAILLFITPYAYLSIPLLFAALSAARVVKAKSIKGLGLFFLIYFSLFLPIQVAYTMVDYGYEKAQEFAPHGIAVDTVIYAVSYYLPPSAQPHGEPLNINRTVPIFTEINRTMILHGEPLLTARLSELIEKLGLGNLRPRVIDMSNMSPEEMKTAIAAALMVLAKNILTDYSIAVTIATLTIWFGLGLGGAIYSYINNELTRLMYKLVRKSEKGSFSLIIAFSLPILAIVALWIGLAAGLYMFNALSPLGYSSATLTEKQDLILLHGFALLVAFVYPPYIFYALSELRNQGEELRNRVKKRLEEILSQINVLKGQLEKTLELIPTLHGTFKKLELDLNMLEDEVKDIYSWVLKAKSFELLRSPIVSRVKELRSRLEAIRSSFVENVKSSFNVRRATLLDAIELLKSLGGEIEVPREVREADLTKITVEELLRATEVLNRTIVESVEYLLQQYEGMAKSLALLDPRGLEILRSVKADVNSIKANMEYDPFVALEQALKTIIKFKDTYYPRLVELWNQLVTRLTATLKDVYEVVERGVFIEEEIKGELLESLNETMDILKKETGDISELSKLILSVKDNLSKNIVRISEWIEETIDYASRIVGVEKTIIADLAGIPVAHLPDLRSIPETIGRGVPGFIELAETLRRNISYLDMASKARERAANYWIVRRIIDSKLYTGSCVELSEIPMLLEHARWLARLYVRIHFTEATIKVEDRREMVCPRTLQ